jgi:hypothetical protein
LKALEQATTALSGRDCADMVNLPYKVAIDALCRMHDTGTVVRLGRKYSATWALAGTPAALPYDTVAALEAAWRAGGPPPPRGERKTPTPFVCDSSIHASKFFAHEK